MHYNQHPSQGIHAKSDESLFAGCARVFHRKSNVITERLFGVRKTHPVFAQIAAGLGRIKLDFHCAFMHI